MSFEVGLAAAIALLLGNAFFVGAEFGLISARRSSIELQALNGSRAAKTTLRAMEQISIMLAGAQLGVTVCSLALGAIGEPLISHQLEWIFQAAALPHFLLQPTSYALALIIMVYFHVVIGEMVPKNLALAAPERVAYALTPILAFIVRLLYPAVAILNMTANVSVRLLRVRPQNEVTSTLTRDEVAGFVKESHREGLLSEDKEHLLAGALRFDSGKVRSVAIPNNQLVTVANNATPVDVEIQAAKTGFSRFPVKNRRGKLSGYIHVKDILDFEGQHRSKAIPGATIRALTTIQAGDSLRNALTTMQRSGAHLAEVIGPRGKTLGVVALEDILEELVGEIYDDSRKPDNNR